jgi:uncharacterized phage protein (TIGR02216 family)
MSRGPVSTVHRSALRGARDDNAAVAMVAEEMRKARDTGPFPWRELMAIGLGRLRLSSAAFWAMTPRELAAAIEGAFGAPGAPPDRAMLDDLIRRFPDQN